MIKKVLIANRNEVALRIAATCKAEGIKTVSIYTQEDKNSPHVYVTDESYQLSKPGGSGYNNADEVLAIAKLANVDAIHPGYGFFSENASFAQKVIDNKITWIGPSPKNINLMGNKIEARITMEQMGVPVIPGFNCYDTSEQTKKKTRAFAEQIGYPVILKSALGGGGKALRKINGPNEFDTAWKTVVSESLNLFNSAELFLEKYIVNGRHIEIQVAGDSRNAVHFFERECSIQRRNQKVIEEAPARFVSKSTLHNMYAVAISATKKIGYDSIGTFEFIVTPQEEFYFIEMNTRLQVEHPVTEYITGQDLVSIQLAIVQHKQLPLTQNEISKRGHAIECRILSENPYKNFAPSVGKIINLHLPQGPYIRHEHALHPNTEISPYFDSMISKLITYGKNRDMAKRHMINALSSFAIGGIDTNISFLKKIISTHEFESGKFHTQWLEANMNNFVNIKEDNNLEELAIISALLTKEYNKPKKKTAASHSRWKNLSWQ